MTDEQTPNSSQPQTIKITVPGDDTEVAPTDVTPEGEPSAEAEAQNVSEPAPEQTNAYAAKASSAYKQQAAHASKQAADATAQSEAPKEADANTADVWDDMDANPPEGSPVSAEDVSALEGQIADLKDQLVRAVAEQENIRKRMTKEADDARKFAASKFAGDMLSVADNLRRAIDSVADEAREQDAVKQLLEGVELTERELLTAFERHKLVMINPLNEKFDPNLHEAMFEIPSADVDAGTVLQVVQNGYMIADRLLRPARVGVSKAP